MGLAFTFPSGFRGLQILLERLTLPVWSLIVSSVVMRGGGRGVMETTEYYRFSYIYMRHGRLARILLLVPKAMRSEGTERLAQRVIRGFWNVMVIDNYM